MNELEDFIIRNPYVPTDDEQQAIDQLKVDGLIPKKWNSTQNGILSFKENIKKHLLDEQNSYCAYCRVEMNEGCECIQRDHIIPKALHPCWIFEPKNLCLTCYRCNTNKRNLEVLVNPCVSTYPIESNSFKIINPYIDKYSEHISILNDLVYVGVTDKGRFTINVCKLFRSELVLYKAKKKIENDNPNTVRTLLLSYLDKKEMTDDDKNELISKLDKIIQKYKNVSR